MDFTENEIFAYMLSESIERELGLDVETTPDLGAGSVCMSSIQSNEIDGYVDYTGTLYVFRKHIGKNLVLRIISSSGDRKS